MHPAGDSAAPTGTETTASDDAIGRRVDEIVVEIDYNIIRHFSEHLYGSPNKAVEELVSNGFDALASDVFVYIPGRFTQASVLVWDNGASMDIADLHKLWWIAQSPKTGDRIAKSKDGQRERAMIGKFGIGKLASYAVGHRITHLCRRGHRYLLVSVDYREVPHLQEGEESKRYTTPILELSEEQARRRVEALVTQPCRAQAELWDQECWTLAIIDKLKDNAQLTEGRLGWVVGNGMPLRPDFHVWVNDQPVEPKLAKGAMTSWDLSEQALQEGLAAEWKKAVRDGRVEGDYEFRPAVIGAKGEVLRKPAEWFPRLGEVNAEVHLFKEPPPRDPRSYGFFVMVRGRLVNPNDAQLFLPVADPSFGTFYRSQYVIHANGLDADLLADRDHLRLETPRTRELAVLQGALYYTSRQEIDRYDDQREQQARSESLLPVESREFFREPLIGLKLRHDEVPTAPLDPAASAHIERVQLGETEPLATLEPDQGGFLVNVNHPLISRVHDRVGAGKAAREVLRLLDLLAVAERLFEGFLYDFGLPDDQIDRILRWRDGLLRAIALRYAAAPAEEVISRAIEASYTGDKAFENALAELFKKMGFDAARDGASGRKDVLVVAPIGTSEYRFTVEAKGSKGRVANDAAEISAAAAHRDQVGAEFAVVVAREFAGFQNDPEGHNAAVLQECRTTKAVSIVILDTLVQLLEATLTFHYPLETLRPVLEEIEPPARKAERVRGLQHPTAGFDWRGVLEKVWEFQHDSARCDMVAWRGLWQARPDRWGCSLMKDFTQRLVALQALSGNLLRLSQRDQAVTLHQNPEIVAHYIQTAVDLQAATGDAQVSP